MNRGNSFVKALAKPKRGDMCVCLKERWFWREMTWGRGILNESLSHLITSIHIWVYLADTGSPARYRSSSLATIQYFMMDQSLGEPFGPNGPAGDLFAADHGGIQHVLIHNALAASCSYKWLYTIINDCKWLWMYNTNSLSLSNFGLTLRIVWHYALWYGMVAVGATFLGQTACEVAMARRVKPNVLKTFDNCITTCNILYTIIIYIYWYYYIYTYRKQLHIYIYEIYK